MPNFKLNIDDDESIVTEAGNRFSSISSVFAKSNEIITEQLKIRIENSMTNNQHLLDNVNY